MPVLCRVFAAVWGAEVEPTSDGSGIWDFRHGPAVSGSPAEFDQVRPIGIKLQSFIHSSRPTDTFSKTASADSDALYLSPKIIACTQNSKTRAGESDEIHTGKGFVLARQNFFACTAKRHALTRVMGLWGSIYYQRTRINARQGTPLTW